jgi:hypothetical protein
LSKESQLQTRLIRELTLYFDAEEEAAADLVGRACERGLDLLSDLWGLQAPAECRVYVMTSWPPVLFHAAPWPWRFYLGATLPLRYARIQRVWSMAGGWALRYGRRQVIGIKPPRLLQAVDTGLRERIFVRCEVDAWVQHNTCHELTHVCSEHLRLPAWLHEGLAMITVDRFAGQPTVRTETLRTLATRPRGARPGERSSGTSSDPDNLVYLAVRGYWITRYLAEAYPGLLREQLTHRQLPGALEGALAVGIGLEPTGFWSQIESRLVSHFRDGA